MQDVRLLAPAPAPVDRTAITSFQPQSLSSFNHYYQVPAGVTPDMVCVIVLSTADGVDPTHVPGILSERGELNRVYQQIVTNTVVTVFSGRGFRGGDRIHVSGSLSKPTTFGGWFSDGFDRPQAPFIGTRPGSQATTAVAITGYTGQQFLIAAADRTTTVAWPPTFSSDGSGDVVEYVGGGHCDPSIGAWTGAGFALVTLGGDTSRTITATYNAVSTNGAIFAFPLTTAPLPASSVKLGLPGAFLQDVQLFDAGTEPLVQNTFIGIPRYAASTPPAAPIAPSGTPVGSETPNTTVDTNLVIDLASNEVGALNYVWLSANGAGGVDPAPSLPAGWTLLGSGTDGTGPPAQAWLYRAPAGTSGTTNFAVGTNACAVSWAYTGLDPVTPEREVTLGVQAASSTAKDTETITSLGSWIVSGFADRNGGGYSAFTDTFVAEQNHVSSAAVWVQDSNGDVAAGSQQRTATGPNTGAGVDFIMELVPAAGLGGGNLYTQTLTAALSFVGSLPKRTARSLRSLLTFQNLIASADTISFEGGTVGAWDGTVLLNDATVSVSTVRSSYGERSMLVTWPTSTALATEVIAFNQFTARRGHTYRMTARVWVPSGSVPVRAQIYPMGSGSSSTTNDAWEDIVYEGVFNSADTTLSTVIFPGADPTAGHQVYVDHVKVEDLTGGLTKRTARALAAALTFVGVFFKQTRRALAAALSFNATAGPPTLVSYTPSPGTWGANLNDTQTTGSISVQAGDLILVVGGSEIYDTGMNMTVSDSASNTYTQGPVCPPGAFSTGKAHAEAMWATAATTTSLTVSANFNWGADNKAHAYGVFVYRDHGGIGNYQPWPNDGTTGYNHPDLIIDSTGDNSAWAMFAADWQANAAASPVYRNDFGTANERSAYPGDSVHWGARLWSHDDAGPQATSQSIGISSGTGSSEWYMVAVEVLGSTGSSVASLTKRTNKVLSGALSFVGSLGTFFSGGGPILVSLTAALGFTGSLAKRTAKPLPAALSFTGNIAKRTARSLAGSLSFGGVSTGSWINRSVSENTSGGTTATYNFTPATAGNLLVAVCMGPVTWTTPSGWTLSASQVGGAGLYVFTKTASSGESSFSSTHNGTGGADYPNAAVIYEFAAGSAYIGTAGTSGSASMPSLTMPTATGLSGTYTAFTVAAANSTPPNTNAMAPYTWSSPTMTADYTRRLDGNSSDAAFGIGALDGATGSTFSCSLTITDAMPGNADCITFAISAVAPSATSLTKQTGKTLAAGLSFTGSIVKRTARALAAALSFVGSLAGLLNGGGTAYNQSLNAALSFSGNLTKRSSRALTAALGFAGSLSRRTSRTLAAGLTFAGTLSRSLSRSLSASLGFVGALSRRTSRALSGALSFSGSLAKRTARALGAGLSFVGTLARSTARSVALSASLAFTGVLTKSTSRLLAAGLSFTGAIAKQTRRALAAVLSFAGNFASLLNGGGTASSRSLTAALSFAGNLAKRTGRALGAGLAFTGTLAKRTSRALAAALSFLGSLGSVLNGGGTAYTQALNAALSFSGGLSKRTSRSLSASLGFVGSLARTFPKALTAALTFAGSLRKRTGKQLAGGLSFVGDLRRRTTRALTAALTFSGSIARRTARALTSGLSFAGTLGRSRLTLVLLSAALSFSGSLRRRTTKVLDATLTLTGALRRRTSRALAATLTFAGTLQRARQVFFTATLSFTGSLARSIVEFASLLRGKLSDATGRLSRSKASGDSGEADADGLPRSSGATGKPGRSRARKPKP